MQFRAIRTLQKIEALYKIRSSKERFDTYLNLLQGPKKEDMICPVSYYNPMGKTAASTQLQALISLDAEGKMNQVISEINAEEEIQKLDYEDFEVAINLIDDLEGSWSHRISSDYKLKFDFEDMHKRRYCIVPIFTSEAVDRQTVELKTKESIYRTIYWLSHGKPERLGECVQQEIFVHTKLNRKVIDEPNDDTFHFFEKNKTATEESLKMCFFYGDAAVADLGLSKFGLKDNAGFLLATSMISINN